MRRKTLKGMNREVGANKIENKIKRNKENYTGVAKILTNLLLASSRKFIRELLVARLEISYAQ